jgi:plasmid stability protein
MSTEKEQAQTDERVRINVPLPKQVHTELKVRAVREGKELRQLVEELLKAGLGIERLPACG